MAAEARRDVFQAIADPTRREILSLVARKTLNLNAIADKFDISRPAISNHIKILTECGLIVIEQQGRERYCVAQLTQLDEVHTWVDQQRKLWTQRFALLEKHLDEVQFKNKKHVKRKTTRKA